MIDSVHLSDFKSHAQTSIELGRLTSLVGPNSAGKTSVLEAIKLASRLVDALPPESSLQEHYSHHLARYRQHKYRVAVIGDDWYFQASAPYDISYEREYRPGYAYDPYWIELNWGNETYCPSNDEIVPNVVLQSMKREFGRVLMLRPDRANLGKPSYRTSTPPRVEENGGGLPSALAYLMTYKPSDHARVVKSLQSVVPGLTGVRVRPAEIEVSERRIITVNDKALPVDEERTVAGDELVFDMVGADELPASAVSEGTLLTLGILTALWSNDSPRVVLLDDIEQGLHPKAQRALIGQLRKLLDERPEMQIVFTTHSPYIVDELNADEVWLLAPDEEGVSHAKRMSEHPEAQEWLDVLSTGEFWSAEGEEWVVRDGE